MGTKILITSVLLFAAIISRSQSNYDTIPGPILQRLVDGDSSYVKDTSKLVSKYTFKKMVKKDYSMLTTGSDINNQVGRYAALSVDKNAQTFAFSPFNYIVGDNNPTSTFKYIFAINASGRLNNDGFFDFQSRKEFKIGGSAVILFNEPYSYKTANNSINNGLFKDVSKRIINKVQSRDTLSMIENKKIIEDSAALKEAYYKEVEKYETIAFRDNWIGKHLWWTKIDFGYREDKLSVIDTLNSPLSVQKPIAKSLNSAYLALSMNYFYGHKSGFNFYGDLKITFSQKTSLSEIYSTKEWNKIAFAGNNSDSLFYTIDNQKVYLFDMNSFHKRTMLDYSFQGLLFFPERRGNQLGVDFIYQQNGFITPGTKSLRSSKNTISLGLILPLKDKDGATTINIEPFTQWTWFNNYDTGGRQRFWGVKFGLPLNAIF